MSRFELQLDEDIVLKLAKYTVLAAVVAPYLVQLALELLATCLPLNLVLGLWFSGIQPDSMRTSKLVK